MQYIYLFPLAQLLKPFIIDNNTVFIISSNLCYWEKRFSYIRPQDELTPIKAVQNLDCKGIELLYQNNIEGNS